MRKIFTTTENLQKHYQALNAGLKSWRKPENWRKPEKLAQA
jgi:hypothetical protein